MQNRAVRLATQPYARFSKALPKAIAGHRESERYREQGEIKVTRTKNGVFWDLT
jgi:hypothetical protein